jgi:hypothetical protein
MAFAPPGRAMKALIKVVPLAVASFFPVGP